MMVCTACVLVLALAVVHGWPRTEVEIETPPPSEREMIAFVADAVMPTVRPGGAPPPLAPRIPVEVPNDTPLDFPYLDFNVELPSVVAGVENGLLDTGDDESGGGSYVYAPPRPLRFVEPEITPEARRRGIRARIVVRVNVDADGKVTSAEITLRHIAVDRAGTQLQAVDRVSYGLEEAALTAARQWLFRPARDGGQAVPAHYDLTFSFGV